MNTVDRIKKMLGKDKKKPDDSVPQSDGWSMYSGTRFGGDSGFTFGGGESGGGGASDSFDGGSCDSGGGDFGGGD